MSAVSGSIGLEMTSNFFLDWSALSVSLFNASLLIWLGLTVACAQCHIGTPAKFAQTASQCSACHAAKDVHGGQFRGEGREEECSSCHRTAQWTSNVFNHDRARFALDVAHRNVACEKCHKEQKNALGRMIRIYRDTPAECVKCH